MPIPAWQEREQLFYAFDDLAHAAAEQVETAHDIADMIRDLRDDVLDLIGR